MRPFSSLPDLISDSIDERRLADLKGSGFDQCKTIGEFVLRCFGDAFVFGRLGLVSGVDARMGGS